MVLLLSLSGSIAWAQLYSGSIVGVITDSSNAVIPGAKVSLADENKGFTFSGTTDSVGRYLFRSVPPGKYKISAAADGFQGQTRTGVIIDVNQNVTIDFSLQLSGTTQSVNITSEAPLLSTADAVTGQVLNQKFINDLPNINRAVMDLAYLTPGVVSTTNGSHSRGNDFISSGSRNATADVLTDGVTVTNFEQNSGIQVVSYTPSPDAVEEFKVQTSNFSAEFGFSGATIVNMVTRSGTNEFHGSAYEYLRNQKLDANDFFDNSSGIPIPGLRRNNFGATIGGPIKRNKTFFFFDYDGLRQVSQVTQTAGVPSAAERQGNFGELCGYQGGTFDSNGLCSASAGQLWDPYTGVYSSDAGGAVRSTYIPFNNLATYVSPGNPNLNGTGYQAALHAGNLIDPVAAKMIQYFPLPNLAVGTPNYQYYNNWIGSGPNINNNDQWDLKIDHRFSDKSLLSARYSQSVSYGHQYNCFGNLADPCTQGPNPGTAHAFAANVNHIFSPTLLLTVSYGYNRVWAFQKGIHGDYSNLDPVALLGMPKYMDISGVPAFPSITIGDAYSSPSTAAGSLGTQPWSYLLQGNDTHQLLGNLSWTKGSHELKFGAEGRMHRINYANPGPTGGTFGYDYTGTSQTPDSSTGGDALASFLTGFSTSNAGGFYEVPNYVSSQNFQWSGYIQDNWKILRKLTLNIGLRYDLTLPRTERYNRMNWVDPTVISPLQVPSLGPLNGAEVFASPNDRNNYAPDYTNFQPRFGFAWEPVNKTVVRGGYGMFYSTTKAGAAGPGAWGWQGFVEDTPWITTYNNDGATPWGRLSDPYPGTGPKLPPGNALGLLNDVGFSAVGPIKTLNSVPYEQTWSLGIQREIPWNILIDANYVGKKGTHLYFGGAGEYDHLGPQIEQYSRSQIAGLLNYVSNPFFGIITDPNSALSSPTIQQYQLQLPFPQFTSFGGDSPPVSNSIYNALQMRVEKRFSSGLQFLVTYAFSKAIDDASTTDDNITWLGGRVSLQDPNNRRLERGVSLYDITHVFQFSHVYELPFGHGKTIGNNWNPVVNGLLGGWQFNGIWTFDSGRPLSLSLRGAFTLPTYGTQRPDLIGTPKRNTGSDWMTQYFANPDVFVAPPHYAVGNAPRNLPWIRTPGQRNATLSLFKEFSISRIREGMRLEYRIEALNAFNHPQFAAPHTTVGSDSFGTVTSQANAPREVQMALKLYF